MMGLFLTLGKMIPPLRLAGRGLVLPVLAVLAGVTVTVAPAPAVELHVLDVLEVLVLVLGLQATRTLVTVHPYTSIANYISLV